MRKTGSPEADQGFSAPSLSRRVLPVVVVGGSGFIGSNVAHSLLREGRDVIILDNLSRPGVEQNLRWLQAEFKDRVHPVLADVRRPNDIAGLFTDAEAVFHFAAQTAVTTSLVDPVGDFETNARGTLNVLEAVRKAGRKAPVIFASTNKVYGDLSDLAIAERDDHYAPEDQTIRAFGVGEDRKLDFCTPYGCSKGVADQYVLDYAKSFGLPTAVLRMSCIYGPRQFGTEDQGWVAHFLIRALRGEPISIFGDGKQVRDILHVNDAVSAYRKLLASIDETRGRAFNLGGGPANAISIALALREIEKITGRAFVASYDRWRAGDQSYFVADTRRLQHMTGWRPTIGWRAGIRHLHDWLMENRRAELMPAQRRVPA
jgi:CDP-paratose 2-epimerase